MAAGVRVALVATVLLALACGKRSQTDAGKGRAATGAASAGEKTEDEVSPKRPDTAVEDDALARAIDRKICRKRGCCVSNIEDAGKDRKGRSLVVATIDAGYGGVASCLVTPPSAPEPFGSGALDKEPCPIKPRVETPAGAAEDDPGEAGEEGGDSEGGERASGDEDCRPYEYHLVVHAKGKIRARQLLSEACNNGYGVGGVGEDTTTVDVKAQTFTHDRDGGSAWRWSKTITVGFDPLRVVSAADTTFWTMDEDATWRNADWNYDTLQATDRWSIPDCEGRRQFEEAKQKTDAWVDWEQFHHVKTFEAVSVPRVQLPAAYLRDGWRSIGLGNCGALVDGDEHGYAVYGGKGKAADAAMRAVVSTDGVLFVEISDDRWTGEGRTWVKEDHIELWLAPPGGLAGESMCDAPATPDDSRQWGIRISDGKVFPAFGSPDPLAGVEVVRSGHVARARIPAADWLKGEGETNALTIVYSDSDDGVRQKRLIATSQIERGHEFSLGHVRDFDPAEVTCVVKGKTLQVNRPRVRFTPNAAMADP